VQIYHAINSRLCRWGGLPLNLQQFPAKFLSCVNELLIPHRNATVILVSHPRYAPQIFGAVYAVQAGAV
jgi:hypothetical protein